MGDYLRKCIALAAGDCLRVAMPTGLLVKLEAPRAARPRTP
jgi:hypothetical protein